MRALAVVVHRYVGLVLAGFLLIAGLTGSLLVWYHELDAALNAHLMRVAPPGTAAGNDGAPLVDPLSLRERVRAAYPGTWANHVSFRRADPREALAFHIEPPEHPSDIPMELAVDEVFVNPYTGDILGARKWGDITQGLTNLMPFIYRLHYSLALGTVGTWLFGIVALLWTVDCFVGAWLTFPSRPRAGLPTRNWWERWRPAWTVRWREGSYRLNFDLHRAGGLWPWALLLVLAWSSVAFNLHEPVYRPVMQALFELQPDPRPSRPPLAVPQPEPAMGWDAAVEMARAHMATQSRALGFDVLAEDRVSYDPRKGHLRYVVVTDRDVNERNGQSSVFVDTTTGELIATVLPTGRASGDTVTSWITSLHMAQVWGLPLRVLMTVMGLVALLSATGLVIWWKKRAGRRANAGRRMRTSLPHRAEGEALRGTPPGAGNGAPAPSRGASGGD